ncbi:hypothetical protein ACKKBF_B37600 [Auxenochlorella protothecoides x Auxenochlorella symbiontica]
MAKDQDLNPANTSAYVQVLGVGADAPSSSPSVLLFFDRQRYLFNMGEGFQRYCVEHRIKLARMSALLLTRVSAATAGGLPGSLLTMADSSAGGLLAGQASMALHGPPGLSALVNAYRTFVNLKDVGLGMQELQHAQPAVANELVTITPFLLTAGEAEGAAAAGGEVSALGAGREGPTSTSNAEVTAGSTREAAGKDGEERAAKRLKPGEPGPGAVACYAAELPDIPGKFQPQKAAALGVPRGPTYGRLVRGESVLSTNGSTITPADVMDPATPGPVVLVVDCPSAAYLPALAASEDLQTFAQGGNKASKVACIVHLTPAGVLALPEYQAWAARFDPGASHILASAAGKAGQPVMRAAAGVQAKLNALDATVFPLQQSLLPSDGAGSERAIPLPGGVAGDNLLRFNLRPVAKRGLDSSEVPEALSAEAVRAELAASPAGEAIAALGPAAAVPGDHPPPCLASAGPRSLEVTFLGTGAAVPSKYRNVTGTLVDCFEAGALLVDCGEGTLGQLERSLGRAGTAALLRRLRGVWISHIHADHHVGLASVLAARAAALGADAPALTVLAPRSLRRALGAYAALEAAPCAWVDVACSVPGAADVPEASAAALARLAADLGLARLVSFRVEHCAHAYGLALEAAAGWKLVFSGDTRPCEAVRDAARGATLLVHEATFEDELAEEALAKNHCTTSEAVDTAAAAGAYRTVLTHFSQRYPKIPVIDANFQGSVGIAFDLMRINLVDLPRLPSLVPKLKLLFAEPEDAGVGDD